MGTTARTQPRATKPKPQVKPVAVPVAVIKPKLLTVKQAAQVLAISERSLYRRLMRKEIPSFKIGSQRRLSVAALDLWIEQQQHLMGA